MSCPSWCSRAHTDDEHVSAAEVVVPQSAAALVTACGATVVDLRAAERGRRPRVQQAT